MGIPIRRASEQPGSGARRHPHPLRKRPGPNQSLHLPPPTPRPPTQPPPTQEDFSNHRYVYAVPEADISIMPTLDYYGFEHEDAINGFVAEYDGQPFNRWGSALQMGEA